LRGVILLILRFSLPLFTEKPYILASGKCRQRSTKLVLGGEKLEQQYVLFTVGAGEFGVPIGAVQEIIRFQKITVIPNASETILGIINLRERTIPVVDSSRLLQVNRDTSNDSRIIIFEVAGKTVGLVVDSVTEVVKIDQGEIEDSSEIFCGQGASMASSVGRIGERLILLLELEALFMLTDIAACA
jgi:purine-binding chemotaxis protein CheW